MLGSDVLAVRLGGIHALDDLARERPGLHHVRVVALLCAFVRHPTGFEKNPGVRVTGEGAATMYEMRPDVRAALEAVAYRSEAGILIENDSDVPTDGLLDLQGVDLRGVQLARSNFCGANLQEANLHHALLSGANLSGANLQNAELSSVALEPFGMIGASADLSYAMLDGAVMTGTLASGANFSHAHLGTSSNTDMIRDIDMRGMKLSYADLSHAVLGTADLRDATLEGCDLTGTVFCETTIRALHASRGSESQEVLALLTQAQLDTARCVPGHPPIFEGTATDIETGAPLEWRGRAEYTCGDSVPWIGEDRPSVACGKKSCDKCQPCEQCQERVERAGTGLLRGPHPRLSGRDLAGRRVREWRSDPAARH